LTPLQVLGDQEGKSHTEGQGGEGSQDGSSHNGDNNGSDGSAISATTITTVSGLGEGRAVGVLDLISIGSGRETRGGVGRDALEAVGEAATCLLGASVASIDGGSRVLGTARFDVFNGALNAFTVHALVLEASSASLSDRRAIGLGGARVAVGDLGASALLGGLVASPDGTGIELRSGIGTVGIVLARHAKVTRPNVLASATRADVTSHARIGSAAVMIIAISSGSAATKTDYVRSSRFVGIQGAGSTISTTLDTDHTRDEVTLRDDHIYYYSVGTAAGVGVDLVGIVEDGSEARAIDLVVALRAKIAAGGGIRLSAVGNEVGNTAMTTTGEFGEGVYDTITAGLVLGSVVGCYDHSSKTAGALDGTGVVDDSSEGVDERASEDSAE
jgi:hypothetical protein